MSLPVFPAFFGDASICREEPIPTCGGTAEGAALWPDGIPGAREVSGPKTVALEIGKTARPVYMPGNIGDRLR